MYNSEKRIWLEHVHPEWKVDVVAIPFELGNDVVTYDLDLGLADKDLMVYPSESVSIIGFPQGFATAGKLPIWKTGNVASDIDIDWNGKPIFLIDATTKSGMSGLPVIAKRVCIYQTLHGNQIGNTEKFLGVYSGRMTDDYDVEVGIVWKPRVIREILEWHE